MDWLLTDEEAIAQVPDICYLVKGGKGFRILREANKAQAKKLVEWLESHNGNKNCYQPEKLVYGLVLLNRDWQALKKDLGS